MNRIELLAFLAKDSKVLCDIGCDHAYSLALAIKNYNVGFGIAADINEGPLDNAKKTIAINGLEDKIKTVISSGFENISDEFDTAIISGMGGILICDILSRSISKIKGKKLIIEANSDSDKVRKFLLGNGFKIAHEEAIYDKGKYYEIMVFIPGVMKYDYYDILYGPLLRRNVNEAFRNYYQNKLDLLKEVISKISDSKRDEKLNLYNEIKFILENKKVNKYFINNTPNYYRTYFLDEKKRPTIIVAPGGGYVYTSPRESEPVVLEFHKKGYHVVVINYRETNKEAYPLPGSYLAAAINEVLKDERIGSTIGLGFSAGGHAILELMLHHNDYKLEKRLDLLMLAYPVITSNELYAHMGSFENLLFENNDNKELREYLSLETQVTSDNAVDLFLWATFTDTAVPIMNSLLLLEAYKNAGGNAECHIFPFGPHGMSVGKNLSGYGINFKESPYVARWIDMADEWINLKLKGE